jgi:hypothetical protein
MRDEITVSPVERPRGLGTRVLTLVAWAAVMFCGGLASVSAVASGSSCSDAPLRVEASAGLADCRVYEQVSPPAKGGFAAYPASSLPAQLSSSGEALVYLAYQAFPGAVGNTALFAAHVSTRTSHGWQTVEWTPRVPKAEVLKLYKVDYAFSRDLSQAVIRVPLIPLASGAAPFTENLFLRAPQSGPEITYSLINSTPPRVPPEAICEAEELATCWESVDVSAYAGASSDFSRVMFESSAQPATENVPETFGENLYEGLNGAVRLVGVLPDGQPSSGSTLGAGSRAYAASGDQEIDGSVERAVSQDGSHVVFQAPADGGEPNPEQAGMTEVYDRIGGAETIPLSVPAPGSTPAVATAQPATFQTASVTGSRVFFTSAAELTTSSNTGEANNSEDLYEYSLVSEQLTDLTVDTNPSDTTTGAMVQGVVDSSSDGSFVYFVAKGQLVEGKGIDGQPNLYMVHNGGAPVFIATLSSTGSCHFASSESADSCDWSPFPAVREAYVTPDGRHMAFMSTRSLPTVNFPAGYDNLDQETRHADSEVYEYISPTNPGGTGQLLCASCDPSGAAPVGNALIGGISPTGVIQEGRVAVTGVSTPFYRVRALSDDGRRLFYATPATLESSNNSVFEYEQDGVGSCEDVRGCHNLLSSPGNTEAALFLGSSSDGNDVFFATSSRLVPTDSDNLRDVYDARVDGGFPAPTAPPCETICYQPGVTHPLLSPESLATGPSGNAPAPVAAKPPRCKKGFRLSLGKCVRAKKQRKKHHKKSAGTRKSRGAR